MMVEPSPPFLTMFSGMAAMTQMEREAKKKKEASMYP